MPDLDAEHDGFSQYRRLLLAEIAGLKDEVKALRLNVAEQTVEIATLKLRMGTFSAIISAAVALLVTIIGSVISATIRGAR